MRLAQAEIGKPVEFARADAFEGAERTDAIPVDIADIGSRRHAGHAQAGEVRRVEAGLMKRMSFPLPDRRPSCPLCRQETRSFGYISNTLFTDIDRYQYQ